LINGGHEETTGCEFQRFFFNFPECPVQGITLNTGTISRMIVPEGENWFMEEQVIKNSGELISFS